MCGAGVSRDTGVLAYEPRLDLWLHFNPVTWHLQSLECKTFIFDKRRFYCWKYHVGAALPSPEQGAAFVECLNTVIHTRHNILRTQGLYTAVICQYTFVKQFVPDLKGTVV